MRIVETDRRTGRSYIQRRILAQIPGEISPPPPPPPPKKKNTVVLPQCGVRDLSVSVSGQTHGTEKPRRTDKDEGLDLTQTWPDSAWADRELPSDPGNGSADVRAQPATQRNGRGRDCLRPESVQDKVIAARRECSTSRAAACSAARAICWASESRMDVLTFAAAGVWTCDWRPSPAAGDTRSRAGG